MSFRQPLLFLGLLFLQPQRSSSFGHALLPQWAFRNSYIELNHGSYGSTPRIVTDSFTNWTNEMEACPNDWFRFTMWDYINPVRARMAAYIGSNVNDTVFVENASSGVNAVIKSLARIAPSGQKFLFLNTAYFMVKQVFAYVEPNNRLQVNVTQPLTNASVIANVKAALEANKGNVFAASFSHIVSVPGVILPVKDLIDLCHQYGVLVLIDGAHALGHIPVNVTDLNADFWIGNGHKWLYSPKGSALLWVKAEYQNYIEPNVISWEGVGVTHFQMAFSYVGTTTNSQYLAMATALDFRESIGGDRAIMDYIHTLAVSGGKVLAEMWKTEVLFDETMVGGMVDVRVPTTNATLALSIGRTLIDNYNTFVPIYDIGSVGGVPGVFYARVSAQVYLEISDFEYLAKSVQEIINSSM
jgi:hercynylcysteine S-oxide lyase